MNAYPTSLGQLPAPQPPRKNYWQRTGGKFLVLSILAHILFVLGAAYLVIHTFTPPARTFVASLPAANADAKNQKKERQMERTKSASTAEQPKRAATTMPVKIVVPDIELPHSVDATAFTRMTAGPGLPGYIPGSGHQGTGQPGIGGPGSTMPAIGGFKEYIPGALTGRFYDLKLTNSKKDSGMNYAKYGETVTQFVKGNWNESLLSKYLKGTHPLYATQIFFPEIESTEGPKAFDSPAPDSPGMWVVVYKGTVSPPESGIYHFVGAGDDDMIVRFNGKLVLDKCEHIAPQIPSEGTYHYPGLRNEFGRGLPVAVEAGKYYDIEILIGDHIPTKTMAVLLIEKEGVTYEKAGDAPILPPFTVGTQKPTATISPTTLPAHVDNGPVWMGKPNGSSLLEGF